MLPPDNAFDASFKHIVGLEGGYVNDPRDPGGETNYGIAKKFHPQEDIKNMTLERAKEIYKQHYWDKAECDNLRWPLNMYVFDAAINQGVVPAIKMLQEVAKVPVTGTPDKATFLALSKTNTELETLYLVRRAMRYIGTMNFNVFGRGWLKRLFSIAIYGAKNAI